MPDALPVTTFPIYPGLGQAQGRWWRWALVGPDGVAPSRMVGVSASVNLPLHHKVRKLSSGTGSPGWSQKIKRVVKRLWLVGQAQERAGLHTAVAWSGMMVM